jgi:hypothetical protein
VRALLLSAHPLRPAIAAAATAALLAVAAGPAAAFTGGETVHLTGAVADVQGRPLPGLAVTLSAARSYFSVRRMRSAEASARTVTATTDAQGRYALDWPWDDHYNRFELSVGIPLHKMHGDDVEVLARRDLSDQMLERTASGPIVTPFTIQKAAYAETVRRFVASLASDDERRVYDGMGHPDEVRNVRYPDHDEVSWWYFESGKVYRFEGGKLAQVVSFDPIKPF